jgi:HD superfamily phosphodiesterase
MTVFFREVFKFVMTMSAKNNIDSTHDISHTFQVLNNACKIYEQEKYTSPTITQYEKIIYSAAALHDMCDDKYTNVDEGMHDIDLFLERNSIKPIERKAILDIISTMSYSKVKKNGFPCHGEYQRAFHIVREADLLAAYDFDRCILYKMHRDQNGDVDTAFREAEDLFKDRVFKHKIHGLLTTKYATDQHDLLCATAEASIETWRNMLSRIRPM